MKYREPKELAYTKTMYNNIFENAINGNGAFYLPNGKIDAIRIKDKNGTHIFNIREDEGLAMTRLTKEEEYNLCEEMINHEGLFTLVARSSLEENSYLIKVPKDSEKDLKGLTYPEKLEKIDKVDHINIWFTNDEIFERDRYCSGWVFVEVPNPEDGVRFIPIIIFNCYQGICVHPQFHKYFLRAFSKRDRHLILGYCYLNGNIIIRHAQWSLEAHKDLSDSDLYELQKMAFRFKESDVPKRIDQVPAKKYKNQANMKTRIDNYYKVIKYFRDQNKA